MFKIIRTVTAAVAIGYAGFALADNHGGKYALDPSHSQVVFSYNHLGYSTTYTMFSGFNGTINFDAANPAKSSVNVTIPVKSMITGWDARKKHFMNTDFFNAKDGDQITFKSTSIKVTGKDTAEITGNLTMNNVTKPVVLETKMTKAAPYPIGARKGIPSLGFFATTKFKRSAFNLGKFVPFVGDEIKVQISIEANKSK